MIQINNGKQPDDPINAMLHWIPLPSETPYGNFQLKFVKIVQRIDQANRRIRESVANWELCQADVPALGAYETHVFCNEEIVYMIRRAADELISLLWCLSSLENEGRYPERIKVDCLGSVLNQDAKERHQAVAQHVELIRMLNEMSNAFKHSFVNSDQSLLGADGPRIHSLAIHRNRLGANPEFHGVLLSELIDHFDRFYGSCVDWLGDWSDRNQGN